MVCLEIAILLVEHFPYPSLVCQVEVREVARCRHEGSVHYLIIGISAIPLVDLQEDIVHVTMESLHFDNIVVVDITWMTHIIYSVQMWISRKPEDNVFEEHFERHNALSALLERDLLEVHVLHFLHHPLAKQSISFVECFKIERQKPFERVLHKEDLQSVTCVYSGFCRFFRVLAEWGRRCKIWRLSGIQHMVVLTTYNGVLIHRLLPVYVASGVLLQTQSSAGVPGQYLPPAAGVLLIYRRTEQHLIVPVQHHVLHPVSQIRWVDFGRLPNLVTNLLDHLQTSCLLAQPGFRLRLQVLQRRRGPRPRPEVTQYVRGYVVMNI